MEEYLEGVIDCQGYVPSIPCTGTSMIEGQVHCRHQHTESSLSAVLCGCGPPPRHNVWSVSGKFFNSQAVDSFLEGILLTESKQFSLVVGVDAITVITFTHVSLTPSLAFVDHHRQLVDADLCSIGCNAYICGLDFVGEETSLNFMSVVVEGVRVCKAKHLSHGKHGLPAVPRAVQGDSLVP